MVDIVGPQFDNSRGIPLLSDLSLFIAHRTVQETWVRERDAGTIRKVANYRPAQETSQGDAISAPRPVQKRAIGSCKPFWFIEIRECDVVVTRRLFYLEETARASRTKSALRGIRTRGTYDSSLPLTAEKLSRFLSFLFHLPAFSLATLPISR